MQTIMKLTYLLLFFGILISCENKNENNCKGRAFLKINTEDSLCFDLHTDISNDEILEISKTSQKKVLVIFTSFTNPDRDILSKKFISDPEISSLLQQITIIRLNVDNTNKKSPEDSLTIGNKNYELEVKKFERSTQPFHVFIDKNMKSIGKPLNYTPERTEIIEFLKQ